MGGENKSIVEGDHMILTPNFRTQVIYKYFIPSNGSYLNRLYPYLNQDLLYRVFYSLENMIS